MWVIGFFLSLMAVERLHFHSILLLILSLKLLFIKDSFEEGTVESVQVLIPSTCEYYFVRQRHCICVWLRVLSWGCYPGLSGWALNAITNVFIRGKLGEIIHRRGNDSVILESEIGIMQPQARVFWWHPEAARVGNIFPQNLWREGNLLALWYWSSEIDFEILASRTERFKINLKYISVILRHQIYGNL